MEPDPRFPNRPTHPDFDILSEEACAHDSISEASPELWQSLVANCDVDFETLMYMILNRANMAAALAGFPGATDVVLRYASGMLDGFVLGVAFNRRKQTQPN